MSTSSLDQTHFSSSLHHLYDWLNGAASVTLGASAEATGSVTFAANPSPNDTVTFGGTAVTFVASGATGNQVNIGANLAATLTALATFANASADANISKASYAASATAIAVTFKMAGTGGNAFTLAASAATVSGATLSGGVSAAARPVAFMHYETAYTTSGSGLGDMAVIGTSPGCKIGQRKLLTLATKTASGDHVTFDAASFSYGVATVSAVVLTNANDFVLCEWRGSKFEILGYASGVVTHS